jgi:hypothetical protein
MIEGLIIFAAKPEAYRLSYVIKNRCCVWRYVFIQRVQSRCHAAACYIKSYSRNGDMLLVCDHAAYGMSVPQMPIRAQNTLNRTSNLHATAHLRKRSLVVLAMYFQHPKISNDFCLFRSRAMLPEPYN